MAKQITHKHIANIIAFLGAFIQSVAFALILFATGINQWSVAVLMTLVLFVLLYGTTYYLLRHYIKRKLKPIYKVIQTNNTSAYKKLNSEIFDDSNVIADVSKEVSEWLADRVKELDILKKQEVYRKEYVGNVSHELKTPIFNIQGYIETLLDGGLEDTTVNRKYLERASKAINRMISIVRDLETISGLEEGSLQINPEPFDLLVLCNEVVEAQEMISATKKIKLVVKPYVSSPLMVVADRRWISQVVTNLVVNSIMYGRENGSTKIHFLDMDQSVMLEVKDNGIGIEPADQKRIFERFYRVDKSRSRDSGGTGLGLSIVKHVMEAHGKTINVQSEPGKGSSFTFSLDKAKSATN